MSLNKEYFPSAYSGGLYQSVAGSPSVEVISVLPDFFSGS